MAVLTAKKSGKASEAATWTPEVAPSSTSELVVPTGLTVELAASLTVVSAKTEGTGTFSGTKVLTLSGSGHSLNLSASTVIGASVKVILSPGAGTTTEPITNGVDVKTLTISGTSTSKIKLIEALTAPVQLVIKGGLLATEGFTITCGVFTAESATTKELKLGSSLLTGNSLSLPAGVGLTIVPGTSTVEMTGIESALSNFGYTLNNLIVAGTAPALSGTFSLNGTITWAVATGQTVSLGPGATITAAAIARTGTGTIRIQSPTGSTTLSKSSGTVELENVELKSVVGSGGATFIVNNGVDLGGNTGWTFRIFHKDSGNLIVKGTGSSTEAYTARDSRTLTTKASGAGSFDLYTASDARSGGATASLTGTDNYTARDAGAIVTTAAMSATKATIYTDSGNLTVKGTGTFTQSYRAVDARNIVTKYMGTAVESWHTEHNFSDSRNCTAHFVGTRQEAFRAVDARSIAVHFTGTPHVERYGHQDHGSVTATAILAGAEQLRYTDGRDLTVQMVGTGTEHYTTPLKPARITVTLRHSARIAVTVRR